MSGMAELLAKHGLIGQERTGLYACADPDCGWELKAAVGRDPFSTRDYVSYQYAVHLESLLLTEGYRQVLSERVRPRRKRPERVLPPVENTEPYTYPPDPYWGVDRRGRWQYVDYDGESLVVWFEKDGDLWLDKEGEGPVFVRKEDVPVIIEALTRTEENE